MSLIERLRRRLAPPRGAIEGYESEELVDTIYRKTVAYQGQANWPLVEGLETVLDFGGGAGVHYKTARRQSPDIRWAVVETPAMVQRAKELATDRLKFFERIDEAAEWLRNVDLVHSNGAIQYVPDAFGTIQALCAVRAAKLVWHRVPISDGDARREVQTSYLSDNGPGKVYSSAEKLVRYERTWFSERAFIEAHNGYRIAERSPDPGEHGTQQFRFVPR
ncbi:methyltransferase, TIGR04325 family [Bradyrhizobium sp. CCBAU 65884]|uniref:methyltransferase, TIGR04325 family n=1 Tax=Bradyrhizobium sp. CCBAU 65884 TaxID=722477 RepID=UPI0023052B0B|nr:methyltransferase, TIGR04325 family [Bradyrhizobium sp. CCBAU 65884]